MWTMCLQNSNVSFGHSMPRPQLRIQWELRLLYSSPPAVYQTRIKASAAVGTPNSLQNLSQSFCLCTVPPCCLRYSNQSLANCTAPIAVYRTQIRASVSVRYPLAVYGTGIGASAAVWHHSLVCETRIAYAAMHYMAAPSSLWHPNRALAAVGTQQFMELELKLRVL